MTHDHDSVNWITNEKSVIIILHNGNGLEVHEDHIVYKGKILKINKIKPWEINALKSVTKTSSHLRTTLALKFSNNIHLRSGLFKHILLGGLDEAAHPLCSYIEWFKEEVERRLDRAEKK